MQHIEQSVTYSSTRGGQKSLDFRTVVMTGLAHDRGLFVPDSIPRVSREELIDWKKLSFKELAVQVIRKFVKEDQIPFHKLQEIVSRSCDAFRSPDVTPVVEVGGHAILELFHGPTFAFKDVALQMLGNFFEYFLETGSNSGRLTVLGATSGDTGSAAIYGLRGKKGIDCVILFPNGRVSEIQERQMTTVPDSNIHCVAIDGTFDDCQDIVKACFNDPDFREKVKLGAVNSINWCRVLAQTTYYFWSYYRVIEKQNVEKVNYSVPTGNFGDILAGYYAKQMGLPVGKLIVATNENDILHRFFSKGEYNRLGIEKSISPSMDICVSSNFERYLYHLSGDNSEVLSRWMKEFESTKCLSVDAEFLKKAQSDFLSGRADTELTLRAIEEYHDLHSYMLCPHSAVGVSVIHQLKEVSAATVCLATAHHAKFPAAVSRAIKQLPPPPRELSRLASLPTRRSECPNEVRTVQRFVANRVQGRVENKSILDKSTLHRALLVAAIVSAGAVVAQLILKRK